MIFRGEILQRVPSAKLFATGPENSLENRPKFYRMICRVNTSMRSCGVYEIKWHYQSGGHLRQDQRYRDWCFSEAVRRKDARLMYGERLATKRKIYMDCALPEMDHKRPFSYDVVEGKLFIFTREEDRVRFQPQLITTFLEGGGHLWMLDDLWTEVGVLTGFSASKSDFNSSQERICVSSWSKFSLVTFLTRQLS